MSTDNNVPQMPARPKDQHGENKVFLVAGALGASVLTVICFRLIKSEMSEVYPDRLKAILLMIVMLVCVIAGVVSLAGVGSQSKWRDYATTAESRFKELREAHLKLLEETAEYRTAHAAAAEKLDAKQQAERAAAKTDVVKGIVAYQHGAVLDDKDKPEG